MNTFATQKCALLDDRMIRATAARDVVRPLFKIN